MTGAVVNVHPLFPTPLCSYAGFSGHPKLLECTQRILADNAPRSNSLNPLLCHYLDKPGSGFLSLKEPLIQDLKAWILMCGMDFINRVQGYQCDSLQVISSWINTAQVGGSQHPHSHENSWISGTYYLHFQEGHSPIKFWRPSAHGQPNGPYFSLMRSAHQTVFNTDEIAITPTAGTLLLWPSHLLHGYDENRLNERITLSFNLLPNRISGGSYGLSIMPLQ